MKKLACLPILFLFLPISASAQREGRLGLDLGLGADTYSLKGGTDSLSGRPPLNVHSGIHYGVGASYGIWREMSLRLGLDYLSASTSGSSGGFVQSLAVPAWSLDLGLRYAFPLEANFDMKAGLACSYLWTQGGSRSDEPAYSLQQLSAQGPGAKAMLGLEYFFGQGLAVGLEGAYRLARLSPVELSAPGQAPSRALNADGSDFVLDYSGFSGKVVLAYYFGI